MKKVFILLLFVIFSHQINAQIPKTISYQGVLTNSLSQLVPSGTYSMIFKLYDLKSGGKPIWQESQNVTVVNGLFNVILGSVSAITQTFDKQYYLEIEASFNANTYKFPDRVQLTSTAYAFKAMTVEEKPALNELKNVENVSPSDGQVLKWNSSKSMWSPSSSASNGVATINGSTGNINLNAGQGITIDIAGQKITITAMSIPADSISKSGAYDDQVLKWDSLNSKWKPSKDESSPVGSVTAFMGDISKIPKKWLLCDGSALDKSKYPELWNIIATNFGAGYDKSGTKIPNTDFNLPDLRGMFLRGVDNSAGNDPDSKDRLQMRLGGLTGDNVGSVQNDTLFKHTHEIEGAIPTSTGTNMAVGYNKNGGWHTESFGGNETRPKNVYVNYIIKVK